MKLNFISILSTLSLQSKEIQMIVYNKVDKDLNLEISHNWEIPLYYVNESNPIDIDFVSTDYQHIVTYTIPTNIYQSNPNRKKIEGYGLFFSGDDLKLSNQNYINTKNRNTKDHLFNHRIGELPKVFETYSTSKNIVIYDDTKESSDLNLFAVAYEDTTLQYFMSRAQVREIIVDEFKINSNHYFGYRVNHVLNLKIEELNYF